MSKNVVILGAGRIGSAIGKILADKGENVEKWDKDTSLVPNQKDLKETVPEADILFLCIPSFAVRPAIDDIKSMLKKTCVIISLAKSIEEDSRKTMDEVLLEILPDNQAFAILAGPLLAEELETDKGGVAVAGCESELGREVVTKLFSETKIKLEATPDAHGAALCGVIKNVYAMGIGAVDGLEWGDNMKGWITSKALCEMIEIVEALGGRRETVCGSAGFGDFIATGFSEHSGHRGFGEKIAHGDTCKRNKEGCKALPSVVELLGDKANNFPLLLALNESITNNKDIGKTLDELIYA